MQKTSRIIPLLLTVFTATLIAWSGINPSDRAVWYAETLPVPLFLIYIFEPTRHS